MELLLDTNILLWALFDDDHLSKEFKNLISDEANDIYVSMASLWEIEIKHCKNPTLMPYSIKDVFNVIMGGTDFILLGIKPEYLFSLNKEICSGIHNDPFDHVLLATAAVEKVKLLTSDHVLKDYNNLGIDVKINNH